MENKELEKLEKINNDNKLEVVRLQERISNLKKEKEELLKKFDELGVSVDEADLILETTQEEYDELLKEAKDKLGV